MADEGQNQKDVWAALASIGKVLAEGVKQQPVLAFLALLVLLAVVVVAIAGGSWPAVVLFFLLAAALGYMGFRYSLHGQRARLRDMIGLSVPAVDSVAAAAGMTAADRELVLHGMQNARREAARSLQMAERNVRANLFGRDREGRLRMVPGLTSNMGDDQELTISMAPGEGSTGQAFQSGRVNFAIFEHGGWGKDTVPDEELRKVNPELRWIVSLPLLIGSEAPAPAWVLNIDGLGDSRDRSALETAVPSLMHWSFFVNLILTRAITTPS